MKLPYGHRAVVEDAKLLDYVLDPDHPIGRHHALLFEQLLGIARANYGILKSALLDAARTAGVASGRRSPFGRKFEMRFGMDARTGRRHTVLAVWIIEKGARHPRLVTCYVE